jgi:hypothetical protein
MKKGVLSIIFGIISFLGSWGWGFFPEGTRYLIHETTLFIIIYYGFFIVLGVIGLILGVLQLMEKKFKILGFLGIFSCIMGLIALGLMILAELGIIRTVA